MLFYPFADFGLSKMDPSERIPAMLTRVKAGDGDNGFQGEDLLSL